ncbi:MAG: aminomethyl-transferring glycine dehydrogenase subunit GcvPB, partial [Elusimicrobia bacterium]|nr:aminomethyl-transferring glycine dehydrogenase subunit GcvPB [Elusimicrobiota bacterium]
PTETESKETLDLFINAMEKIFEEGKSDPQTLKTAPHTLSVKKLDEVAAARKPNIRWEEEKDSAVIPEKVA